MSLLFLLHMNIPHRISFCFLSSNPLHMCVCVCVLSTQLRTRYEGMDVEGGGKRYQGKQKICIISRERERERKGMIIFHLCPDRYILQENNNNNMRAP